MPPVFTPEANLVARFSIVLLLVLLVGGIMLAFALRDSTYATGVREAIDQPVPFSHAHHVGGLGIDCRYCHTAVTHSSFAGMPSTDTCINCHQQLWTNAAMLAPVRQSWRRNQPIHWQRVYRLPDFVYFNHAIHVNKGVGCATCHGRIDKMPLTYKATAMDMSFCIDCHRHPETRLRPRSEVFNMNYQSPSDAAAQRKLGLALMKKYHVRTAGLLNCSTCHR